MTKADLIDWLVKEIVDLSRQRKSELHRGMLQQLNRCLTKAKQLEEPKQ
jgi:hypothetical protein